MTLAAQHLASGHGWQVHDVVCRSGPGDFPFEEQHETACIAIVTEGTFQYRTQAGTAVLVPGALLLGSAGACYECGHEHATGDRCISFHFSREFLDALGTACRSTCSGRFPLPQLPPLPQSMGLVADAEAARDTGDERAFEEIAVRLAGAVATLVNGSSAVSPRISSREERRITGVLRRIEAEAHEPLSLDVLAQEAGLSRFHFLRTFRRVTGMTPHQYVLRMRLHRAAIHLRSTRKPIGTVALDAGFNDLSTFNRRFRRLMGMSPGNFRRNAANGGLQASHDRPA